ncbi:uncharacterized protein OCT59_016877 [Rhizophagus irregularis]|uniref:uncharacterized protein n=1 Tax=Rhizophagus irregularis TaxID=588596 RepID=UPI00332D4479|nr:hypothetical protein OCT59_016877 [Rhizophagus irregularis]
MGRGKHNSSSMLCKCCYSGENAINFSSLFLVNNLTESLRRLPPSPCGSATTAPLRGSATTAPLRGSATTAPLRGSATTAPLRGSATTAPLRGSATTAPLRGSATTAPLRGSATTAPLRGRVLPPLPFVGVQPPLPFVGVLPPLPFVGVPYIRVQHFPSFPWVFSSFGFVHFRTRRQASLFYIQTRNKSYQYDEDRDRGPFKFYAAKYFNSDRKVNYTLDEEADINDENKPKKRKVIEIIDDDLSSEENSETIQQAREGTYPVAKEAANITGEHVKDFSEGRKGFQETAKGGAKQLATQFKSRVSDYAKPLNVAYGLYENEIEAISAKIEVEHGISTITLRKSNTGKILEII